MSDWITVVSLVVAGFLLLIIEVLFVPGTTIVGILGLLSTVLGIYLSYQYFGRDTAIWFTAGSSLFFAVGIYYSFKSRTWDRFSLKGSLKGKVNMGYTLDLKEGDAGVAISSLKPIGKAEINDKEYEVRTLGQYLDSGTSVKIIKIEQNNIFVEPIN